MLELPHENYSYIPADVQLPGTKWVDNHRSVFTVKLYFINKNELQK